MTGALKGIISIISERPHTLGTVVSRITYPIELCCKKLRALFQKIIDDVISGAEVAPFNIVTFENVQ